MGKPSFCAISSTNWRVMLGRIDVEAVGGSAQLPVRQADHGAGSAFDDPILTIDENGFIGLAFACLLLGHDVGQQIERFDVATAPALIGTVMA